MNIDNIQANFGTIIGLIFLVCLYFMPVSIAFKRKINLSLLVLLLNVFLGWTIIGWIVSLVIALRSEDGRYQYHLLKKRFAEIDYCPKCIKSIDEFGTLTTDFIDSNFVDDLLDSLSMDSKEFNREQKRLVSKLKRSAFCQTCKEKVNFCLDEYINTNAVSLMNQPKGITFSNANSNSTQKECPYCAEKIAANAIKCPYCAENLE